MEEDKDLLLTPFKYCIALTIFSLIGLFIMLLLYLTNTLPWDYALYFSIPIMAIFALLVIVDIVLLLIKINKKKKKK